MAVPLHTDIPITPTGMDGCCTLPNARMVWDNYKYRKKLDMNTVGQLADRFLPPSIGHRLHFLKDRLKLKRVPRLKHDTSNLRTRSSIELDRIFDAPETHEAWRLARNKLEQFGIPDGTGGVNPGDRKAVFYLVNALQPRSVLEIGTHIGASTVHVACALSSAREKNGVAPSLVTVDLFDVNATASRRWERYGASFSPRQMIETLNYGDFVTFVTGTSLGYAATCNRTFDFIFLDGDHSAETVYREVAAALKLLNPGGVILLHDYFPAMKPLWSNGAVVTGPFLAAERLLKEGTQVNVLPLGRLPWPTKLDSSYTSLALLLKNE